MTTETVETVAVDPAGHATTGRKKLNEALASAQAKFSETAKTLKENEKIIAAQARLADTAKAAGAQLKEHAETLRSQTKSYRETAGKQASDAQRVLVEKIKERPVTAAFAGLGIGLLLGMLLSNRSK